MFNRRSVDFNEAVATEELDLERQHEHPLDSHGARSPQQFVQQCATDSTTSDRGINGQGANLSEVLPHHVQRTTSDDFAINFSNNKFLNAFVKRDCRFAQQTSIRRVGVDEVPDPRHIRRMRGPDHDLARRLVLGHQFTFFSNTSRNPIRVNAGS